MESSQKMSQNQIKDFWLNRAKDMGLSQQDILSDTPDMIRMLTAAQESYGSSFWSNNNQIEDVINECLLRKQK